MAYKKRTFYGFSNYITPQIACFVENHIIPKEPH
jgi:hypothetical protein